MFFFCKNVDRDKFKKDKNTTVLSAPLIIFFLFTVKVSNKEMEEYKILFDSMDKNSDGKITLNELCQGMKPLPEYKETNVEELLKKFIWSIKIDFDTFLEIIEKSLISQLDHNKEEVKAMKKLFPFIDKDASGGVSKVVIFCWLFHLFRFCHIFS